MKVKRGWEDLEKKEYDLWADGYGASVHLLNDQDEYPVAGYADLLGEVYRLVRESGAKTVLDVGFGTGILTKKLYQDGCTIYGVDASEQLVKAGKEEMPNAKLYVGDYSMGLPLRLTNETYDMIISTYALHYLDHYERRELFEDMLRQLNPGGKIIIGDLAFETEDEMKAFRDANREKWLDEDMYLVYEETERDFHHIKWEKISKCAGIVTIEP